MAFSLGAIAGSIGLDISSFVNGLAQARSGLSSFGSFAAAQGNAISSTLGGAMTRLGDAMAATHSRIVPFHQAWTTLGGAFQGMTGTIGNVISGVTGLGSRIVSLGSSIGQNIFFWKQLVGTGVDFVTNLFSQNAAMEQTRVAFVGLLGSGKAADAMLRQLQQFAASTPFEFPELAHDSQLLIGMGFSAQSVIPMMTAVGDAVAGVGAGASGVETVVRVLGQMHAAGKLNAGDMMQLTTLGIPAWKMLADAMGLSTAQVMSMTTRGLIPADRAIGILTTSMEKMYPNQMMNQATTFNGLISTLHDNLNMAFQAFLGPAFNAAKSGLLQLTNLMSSPAIMQFATNMGSVVGNAIAQVSRFLAPLLPQIGGMVTSFFSAGGAAQQLGAFLLNNLLVPLRNLVVAIAPVVSDFAQWMVQSGTLQATITILGGAIAGLVIGLGALINGLAATIKWFHDGSPAAQILGAALVGIGVAIAAIQVGAFIATIPALVAGFILWAGAAGAAAVATIAATWPILAIGAAITLVVAGIILAVRNWGAISVWLTQQWATVSTFFSGLWATISSAFMNGYNNVLSSVHSFDASIITAITTAFNGVLGFFAGLWANVGATFVTSLQAIQTTTITLVAGLGTAILSGINGMWNSVNNATHGQLGQWAAFIGEIFQAVFNIIVAVMGRLLTTVVAGWANIFTSISSAAQRSDAFIFATWNHIAAFTSALWGSIWGAITKFVTNIYNDIAAQTSKAAGWVSQQWTAVTNTTSTAWGSVSSATSTAWGNISSTVGTKTKSAWDYVVSAWNGISASTSTIWNNVFGTIGNFLNQIWQKVVDIGGRIKDSFLGVWNSISGAIGGVIRSMANTAIGVLNGMLRGLQTFVTDIATGINAIASAVGATSNVQAPTIGQITPLAKGSANFKGGTALVGEEGPELITLPKGASVLPNRETMQLMKLGLLRGVPGFAGGTGNAFSDLLGFVGGGVTAVGNMASSAFNVTKDLATSVLSHYFSSILHFAGPFTDMAGVIGNLIKGWGVDMVMKLLGTIKAVPLPAIPTGGAGGASFGNFPGNLASWISQAIALTGVPTSWLSALESIAMFESGGNPMAINLWDSNAMAGIPSKGLMQTIDPTFNAHALPGHTNIWNPVDNAAAAIGYIIGRYGTVWNVPGILNVAKGGPYVGYDRGGIISEQIAGVGLRTGTRYSLGENGPERVTPLRGGGSNQPMVIQFILDGQVLGEAAMNYAAGQLRSVRGVRRAA